MKQSVVEPDLQELFGLFKRDVFLSLNCHALGTIELFNAAKQTAQVSINYKKTYITDDTGDQVEHKDYPLLVDCPVVILSGGGGSLTFPVAKGDTCLVLFNDRDIDGWFEDGGVRPPNSERLHSLSDGIALVGIRSLANPVPAYDTTRVALSYGTATVGMGETLVRIANNTTTLAGVLNGLIDLIAGLQTVPVVPSTPAVLDPTKIAALNAYKTTVGGLLE